MAAAAVSKSDEEENSMKSSITEQLECAICHDTLREPRDLDCSHTFCRECLVQYARSMKFKGAMLCPMCRKTTPIPVGGISALKSNILLRNLIDTLSSSKDSRSPKKTSYSVATTLAEHTTCAIHHGVPRDIYCDTCNVIICARCIGAGHCATGHKHVNMQCRADQKRKSLCTLAWLSDLKLADLEHVDKELEVIHAQLNAHRVDRVSEINMQAKEMMDSIIREQDRLIQEVEERSDLSLESINSTRTRLADMKASLEQTGKTIDDITSKYDDESISLLQSDLNVKLKELHSAHLVEPTIGIVTHEFHKTRRDIVLGRLSETVESLKVVTQHDHQPEDLTQDWAESRLLSGGVHGLSLSPDGNTLAVLDVNTIKLFNIGVDGVLIRKFDTCKGLSRSKAGVKFMTNDKLVAITNRSSKVTIFNVKGTLLDEFATLCETDPKDTKVRLDSVVVDRHGQFLVGDGQRRVITIHREDGTYGDQLPTNIEPHFIAVSSKDLIAFSQAIHEVHVMDYMGNLLVCLSRANVRMDKDGDYLSPKDICFDRESKNLYVYNQFLFSSFVFKFSIPGGEYKGRILEGGSGGGMSLVENESKIAVAYMSKVAIFQRLQKDHL